MATIDVPTQRLDPIKGVKKMPLEEFFTSGHRTCQGCESALVMKLMAKAAGPRTIVLGSTGCMYVANTTYYSTSWVVPWMHTQLGSSGSAALGTAAALKVLMPCSVLILPFRISAFRAAAVPCPADPLLPNWVCIHGTTQEVL